METTLIVGTAKGGFILRSSDARRVWSMEGPIFKGWTVTAAERTGSGRTLVATTSYVYGATIHWSDDLETWHQINDGPSYEGIEGRKLQQIWRIASSNGRVYAGVSEAGLFASSDDGATWIPVDALNNHPTRNGWQPGLGGLCAHAILIDPANKERLWCGISAVGVFRTDDGGRTWVPKNEGVTAVLEDKIHDGIGYCVHGLAMDPTDSNRLYRQDHRGMYRSTDAGDTWTRNEEGLPAGFGFPLVADPSTGWLYAVPLESDEYRMPTNGVLAVYRSTDRGDTWEALTNGLPDQHAYAGVLRGAMASDGRDPSGIFFGTTSGSVHVSIDAGDSWRTLPIQLPRILCVRAFADA